MAADRTLPLLGVLLILALGGVVMTPRLRSQVPPPCRAPGLVDGLLTCDGSGSAPGAAALLAGQKISLNQATPAALRVVPGVGRNLSEAIVAARRAQGGFSSWDQVRAVIGVGEKTLAKIQRHFIIVR